jgi:hypothetical protein
MNKYIFINTNKNFTILGELNNLTDLKTLIKSKIKNENIIILLKFTKNKDYSKSKLNLKTGPIKVDIVYYEKTKRGSIKVLEKELRTNFIYYTKDYLEKYGLKNKDFRKIAKASFNKKLNTKLLGSKIIEQIKKIKI